MSEKGPPSDSGVLYMVATPIGNLSDITLRAIEVLKTVDVIAAEDTRHARRLLDRHGIGGRPLSCHEHNEAERARQLTRRLSSGQSVALLTNAGTPVVSDPGYRVLEAAIAAGIQVVPIPGPSAAVAALSAAGLPSDAFFFVGFLPQKGARRRRRLEALAGETATLIFYEAPGRAASLLKEIAEVLGDRRVAVAREMTKRYEEFIRGTAAEVADVLGSRPALKGEFTVLAEGRGAPEEEPEDALRAAAEAALEAGGQGSARLARDLAVRFGVPRNRVYEILLEVKSELAAGSCGKGEKTDGEA
jgi:16S rRNA (cytidine1402-2'-O)-methyltransferase